MKGHKRHVNGYNSPQMCALGVTRIVHLGIKFASKGSQICRLIKNECKKTESSGQMEVIVAENEPG